MTVVFVGVNHAGASQGLRQRPDTPSQAFPRRWRVRAASRADAKGNITAKSDNVRQVLDYARRLAPFLPPDVYSWDDASNNRH